MSKNKTTSHKAADITEPAKILTSEVQENDMEMQNTSENKDVAEDETNSNDVVGTENIEAEFDEALHEELVEEGKEEETTHVIKLRLAKNHPHMMFRLGTTAIEGRELKEYTLTDAQMKELFTAGPMHWLESDKPLSEIKAKFEA